MIWIIYNAGFCYSSRLLFDVLSSSSSVTLLIWSILVLLDLKGEHQCKSKQLKVTEK
nr:MAG TPA: hypothetical protein [Caudoviricetes sp.]